MCYPIPSTPLKTCLDVYHFEADSRSKSAAVCTSVDLKPTSVLDNQLVTVNFGCVKFADGEFSKSSEFSPESKGILNVDFNEGLKPELSFGGLPSLKPKKA